MSLQLIPVQGDQTVLLRKVIDTVNNIIAGNWVVYLSDGVPVPDNAPTKAVIYIDATDGDLKIKFGDGTIKTIVVDT